MTTAFPLLFSPLKLGDRSVRNRIVSTAHGEHLAEGGLLTDRLVDYHARRAAGGAGLLIVFGSASVFRGAANAHLISLWDARNEAKLAALAARVHDAGALILAQASHRGPRESPQGLDDPLQAPSPLPGGFADGYRGTPHVLTIAEIEEIVEAYADAAARLERCGFDGIELTALGTHLIEQFWSPVLNRRTDRYGGDFAARMRFSLDVLAAVKARVAPGFLVSFRISGELATDMLGLGFDDLLAIAQRLDAENRIDLFNVSGGSGAHTAAHAAAVPTDTFALGTYNRIAREMRRRLSVPVLVAGRILTPAQAEAALKDGDCDLVAMTRALIADPDLPLLTGRGELDRVRPCIAINEGCRRVTLGLSLACSVNPAVANPALDELTPAARPRRIAVVGGGPAGMEAARVARQRGHDVVLFERAAALGGQMHAYAAIPGRPHLLGHVRWLERELRRLGVDIRLATEATAALLEQHQPEAVVVATGALTALPPETDGLALEVVTDEAVITGAYRVAPGARIAVYDVEGRVRAAHAALLAVQHGAAGVDLIFPYEMACPNLEPPNRPAVYRALAEAGVTIRPHQTLLPQQGGALRLRDSWSERDYLVNEPVVLVVAGYRRARDELREQLGARLDGVEILSIGDCLAPRLLRNAVADGVRAGAAL
ncbi:MAG TPA: FAD-dependent oxidoreductase [Stellaceae bacterium]|nr:FAD-dependent oxidoreductase [Stellaceae bacterium]